jgi:CubicO group peptidase (beta-lactamase class C family)
MMSLSKSFTAALVLRAIDQGRFGLDTRIADFFPGFGAGGKGRVDVRMLLTHAGGTYAGLAPPPPLGLADLGNLEKFVAAVGALPATFTPGTRVIYNSFSGINALGQLLVVTDPRGRCFRTITKEDLFDPLGMTDSSFGVAADNPRRVPVSQTDQMKGPGFAQMVALLEAISLGDAEVPSGGAYGTVDDVFRFAETLRRRGIDRYRLISPALLDYASQNHTGDLINGGWEFQTEAEGRAPFRANFSLLGGYARSHGHHLTAMGYTASPHAYCAVGGGSTLWMVDPARDLTFVFLSSGLIEGLAHIDRLSRHSDLAIAACEG